MIDLRRRAPLLERMDTETFPLPVMEKTLGFLALTNALFGGQRLFLHFLERWSAHWPSGKTIRVLDVGTGLADIPVALARWARRDGKSIAVTAVDLVPEIVSLARRNAAAYPEITVRRADFFALAADEERYDYVLSNLFLHHCPDEKIRPALAAFDRLAARGVILGDLRREWAGYAAVRLCSALAGNDIVRHDGPISVRRSFRPDELRTLAHEAGLGYLKASSHPWFRLSLAGEKP